MSQKFTFYRPSMEDGRAVSQLISACPPLDTNSPYCNLLQCHHFASTAVAVRWHDELVGFISAYLIPDKPERLFIWQVAVAEKARGHGIASRMIAHILDREVCQNVHFIETTITQPNAASWALFGRVAKCHGAPLSSEELFTNDRHFSGQHDTELLVTIGPLQRTVAATSASASTNIVMNAKRGS
tara:strand:+ start:6683 stop:7237 length:555 start_codon:yes stop_codon:yes gene_type:complete